MLERALALVFRIGLSGQVRGLRGRGSALCRACRLRAAVSARGRLSRCAARAGRGGSCHGCRRLSPAISSVRARVRLPGRGADRGADAEVQVGPLSGAADGRAAARAARARPLHADIVVPVPLAPRRLRQRGYNQALLLAEQVRRAVRGAVVPDALERSDRPAQQTLGGRRAPEQSATGAFTCPAAAPMSTSDACCWSTTWSPRARRCRRAPTRSPRPAPARISALAFARDL